MSKFEEYLIEEKTKYKGTYNWYKENLVKYTYAVSEKQAHNFMVSQIAKQLSIKTGVVTNYFKNTPNSYKIEKV